MKRQTWQYTAIWPIPRRQIQTPSGLPGLVPQNGHGFNFLQISRMRSSLIDLLGSGGPGSNMFLRFILISMNNICKLSICKDLEAKKIEEVIEEIMKMITRLIKKLMPSA